MEKELYWDEKTSRRQRKAKCHDGKNKDANWYGKGKHKVVEGPKENHAKEVQNGKGKLQG